MLSILNIGELYNLEEKSVSLQSLDSLQLLIVFEFNDNCSFYFYSNNIVCKHYTITTHYF